MNDAVGGAIWVQDVMLGDWPDHSGLSLLGQFTVTDPSEFDGTVNLMVLTNGGTTLEMAEGLTFHNGSLLVTGCTDESLVHVQPGCDRFRELKIVCMPETTTATVCSPWTTSCNC